MLSCVHCQQWRKRKWSRSPSTTAAACAQMVLLVTKLRARSSLRLSAGPRCQAQKDSNDGDEVQSKRGVLKYPIAHGVTVGMGAHASDYDSSWLSNELQVDPIIDEPMSFAQGPAFVTVHMLSRHILAITLCGALASVSVAFKKARKAEHVPFASRARQVHEVSMLFLCMFLCHSPITRRPSTISPTSWSCSGRASLVSSVRARHISRGSVSG